jgi:hypothetical protein
VESLHSQFPELDQIEEAGTVGTFMKGAAQNLGQQFKTTAFNALPKGMQQAVKAGQQAVQQKKTTPQQGQNLEQQFQKVGQSADLESQFAQVGQANSAGTSDLINDLTEPAEVFTSALQALQTFVNQPESTQPTQQANQVNQTDQPKQANQANQADQANQSNQTEQPKQTEQPEVNTQQQTAEGIYRHPAYATLRALYEADTPDQTAEFKQAVTKFLGKYSDPAALAKDQKGQQILQKLVQVAGNLGITIPNMPSADQLKNAAAGAQAQPQQQQGQGVAPVTINSPEDLKKALDANPQAAQAFVQALTRAPKNGPIGQAFNNLLQKPAQ